MNAFPSWAVVGTMDEPAPLIMSWVAHHLHVGASEVHVYLDRPNPVVEEAFQHIDKAFVTLCDHDYWAASHRRARPIRHTARQKHNATRVYQTRNVDWVLHCDADEFLHITGDFQAELQNTSHRTLRLKNIERVRLEKNETLFNGGFRGHLENRSIADNIYGRWADFLEGGMAGYKDGKDIVKSGEDFLMGVHFPIDANTNARHTDPYAELNSANLLHFDGLTPLHCVIKLLKRATEPKYQIPRKFGAQRERQFRYAKNHVSKPDQLQKMLDGVFGVSSNQVSQLGPFFHTIGFDPTPALAALNLDVDTSVQTFDQELRRREAALIEETGLAF